MDVLVAVSREAYDDPGDSLESLYRQFMTLNVSGERKAQLFANYVANMGYEEPDTFTVEGIAFVLNECNQFGMYDSTTWFEFTGGIRQ